MDLIGDELAAVQQILERHGERTQDFRFRKDVGPPVLESDGHSAVHPHIEVTTKRRGVKIAIYVGGEGHDWLREFETDVQRRRFRPEGD